MLDINVGVRKGINPDIIHRYVPNMIDIIIIYKVHLI